MNRWIAFPASVLAVTLGCAAARADALVPDFAAATFNPGAPIDNTYFPLVPGTVFTYAGEDATEEIAVTFKMLQVLGVTTTVVVERAFEEGLLVEEAFNYFAQDTSGNVWYFGEDTTDFIRN